MPFNCGYVLHKVHLCLLGYRMAKYRILVGAMILGLSQALPWFYGNFITYEYSYFKYHLNIPNIYDQVVWIYPMYYIFIVIGLLSVDAFMKYASLAFILVSSLLVEDIGLFMSYFTVQHSVWATFPTLSILYGFCQGIKLALGLIYANMSFKEHIGLTTSLVVATNGLGGIMFNTIITTYMNPQNLKPDAIDGNLAYFSYKVMNERFPTLLLILGGASASVQIISVMLIEVLNRGISLDEDESKLYKDSQGSDISVASPKYDYDSITSVQELNGNDTSNCRLHGDTNVSQVCREQSPGEFVANHESTTLISKAVSDQSPGQVLKSTLFYTLWLSVFATSGGLIAVTSCYKLFSQLWIHDDNFLALIGSTNCVAIIVCRVGVGFVVDRFGVFNAIIALLSTNAVSIAFWYFTVQPSRFLFLVYTSLIIGIQSTTFNVFPVAMLRSFGSTYYATNTGFLMSSVIASSIVLPPLMSGFVADVGWFWFFQLISGLSVVPLVILVLRLLVCTEM